jgi:2-isopropylmalate synthase
LGTLKSVKQDSAVDGDTTVEVVIVDGGVEVKLTGVGNGPVAAFCNALDQHGVEVRVLDYNEHAMSAGGDAKAASYLECSVGDRVLWGAGIDPSIVTSSFKAIISAVNRALR